MTSLASLDGAILSGAACLSGVTRNIPRIPQGAVGVGYAHRKEQGKWESELKQLDVGWNPEGTPSSTTVRLNLTVVELQ